MMPAHTSRPSLPLLGFAAYSGTGKTTLLEALIPRLTAAGLRLGILKHAHHDFDVDKPGKDSYRLRKAGAAQMLIASRNRYALMTETPDAEAGFDYLLSRFDARELDVILVEGCKNIALAKIELHRAELGKPWLYPHDNNIIAIAADEVVDSSLPQININDLDAMARFVLDYVDQNGRHQNGQPPADSVSEIPTEPAERIQTPVLLSLGQCRQRILDRISVLSHSESVALHAAYQRVSATPLTSPAHAHPVLEAGQRLSSAYLGRLAALGITALTAYRPLRVALSCHTDFPSHHYTLTGLLTHLGCEVIDLAESDDNRATMITALQRAAQSADAIIRVGPVPALDTIELWQINMHPGQLLTFGHIDTKPFFGLADDLVAVWVSFMNVVEPALRKMQGETQWQPLRVNAIACETLHSPQGQTEFTPGVCSLNTLGQLIVTTHTEQGAFRVREMSEANCLIEIPPATDTVKAGESVTIIPLQGRI